MSDVGFEYAAAISIGDRIPPSCWYDTRPLDVRVAELVGRGTGREAARSGRGAAPALVALWEGAEPIAWHRVPDRALEALASGASVADIEFLAQRLGRGPAEAVAAARVLGCLGEDGLAPADAVEPLLRDFLEHGAPAARVAAAEALWQLADKGAVESLRRALAREEHPVARRTFEHVLRVLG